MRVIVFQDSGGPKLFVNLKCLFSIFTITGTSRRGRRAGGRASGRDIEHQLVHRRRGAPAESKRGLTSDGPPSRLAALVLRGHSTGA